MVAVFGLIDMKYPLRLYKNRKDEFLLLNFTFLVTLFVGIMEGILLGILLSLVLLVYRTSKPHFAVLGKIKGTNYFKNITRFTEDIEIDERILIIRFDSQLYFGNKDFFKNKLMKAIDKRGDRLEAVIINAEPINYIDSSAVFMLEHLIEKLNQKNILVLFSDVIGPTRDILHRSGLRNKIGEENFFVNTSEAYDYAINRSPKSKIQEKISLQTKN